MKDINVKGVLDGLQRISELCANARHRLPSESINLKTACDLATAEGLALGLKQGIELCADSDDVKAR